MSTSAIDESKSKSKFKTKFDDFPEETKARILELIDIKPEQSEARKYHDYLLNNHASKDNIITKTKSLDELFQNKKIGDIIIYTGFDEYVRFSVTQNTGLESYLRYVLNPRDKQPPQYHIILSDAQQRPMFEMIGADLDDIKETCDILVPYFNIDKSDVVYSEQSDFKSDPVKHDIIILSLCGTLSDNISKIDLFIDYVEKINPELARKICLKRARSIPNVDVKYTKLYLSNDMKRIYSASDDKRKTSTYSTSNSLPPIEIVILNGGGCLPPGNMAINITNNGVIGNNNNNNSIINHSSNATLISNEKELIKRWVLENPPKTNQFSVEYYEKLKTSIGNQIKNIKFNFRMLHSIISSCGYKTHKYNTKNAWIKST